MTQILIKLTNHIISKQIKNKTNQIKKKIRAKIIKNYIKYFYKISIKKQA